MPNKVRTHRGRVVDMDEIKIKNQESVAIGNMNVNARGDEIDEYGKVLKTRDHVARDKNKSVKSTATRKASIISAFEDDMDEPVELADDPKAIERNKKSTSGSSGSNATASRQSKANNTKTATKDDKSSGTSETDLD